MTETIRMGSVYQHDSGVLMHLESASIPEEQDYIHMVSIQHYCKIGFIQMWRGSCANFYEQWTEVSEQIEKRWRNDRRL